MKEVAGMVGALLDLYPRQCGHAERGGSLYRVGFEKGNGTNTIYCLEPGKMSLRKLGRDSSSAAAAGHNGRLR
jgi:hypothetical protein